MKKILSSFIAASACAISAQAAIITVADGDLDIDTTWSSSNEYVLTEIVYVRNSTLTIQPGTIIRGELPSGNAVYDPGALVVTTSGRINAVGTATNPIIFTTAAIDNNNDNVVDGYDFFVDNNGTPTNTDDDANTVNGNQYASGDTFLDADPANSPLAPAIYTGDGSIATFTDASGDTVRNEYRQLWGGVIILGEAPVNTDVTSAGGLHRQFIEGLPQGSDSAFGGFNPNDSSGSLAYVSIRHGGAVIGSANEINGLTMGGVGFGTRIDHIDVYCNADDGYEWFGGTVNTKYLTSIFNNDDAFDIDEGFTGLGQFWFCLMNDDAYNGDKGAEHDGETGDGNDLDSTGGYSLPKTYAVVYNATFIGNPTKATEAFRLRDNWGGEYKNSIFTDFGGSDKGIELEGDGESRFTEGDIIFAGNTFYNGGSTTAADYAKAPTSSVDTALASLFSTTFSASTLNLVKDPGVRSLNRRTANGVNPTFTDAQSRANNGNGGAFGVPVTSTFFDSTPNYKGAFSAGLGDTLWTTGWTALNKRGILVDRPDTLSVD